MKQFTEKILKDSTCRIDPETYSGRLIQSKASGNGKTRAAHKARQGKDNYSLYCVPIRGRRYTFLQI